MGAQKPFRLTNGKILNCDGREGDFLLCFLLVKMSFRWTPVSIDIGIWKGATAIKPLGILKDYTS